MFLFAGGAEVVLARRVMKVATTRPRRTLVVSGCGMRLSSDRMSQLEGESSVALDWEAVGRQVRRDALTAVAMHFAELARRDLPVARSPAQAEACSVGDLFPGES